MRGHSKGLATMEILFAVVLISGIIVILMRSITSSSYSTNASIIARDYAIIMNNILDQFTTEIDECQGSSSDGGCSLSLPDEANSNSYLDGMSSSAKNALQDAGIDPTDIKVTVCWGRLDDDC